MDSPPSPNIRPRPEPAGPDTDSPSPELSSSGLRLDEMAPALVRPYVVAHEQRREQQRVGVVPQMELVCAPPGMAAIR
ncbi:hypothetical protein AB0E27_04260 [Streptomyces sparsogenes]|uniref:hypothetical protein n=1 Tax=Streptomyces sparsogenes TaxID=67365 RepID=UPI0033D086FC